MLADEGTVLRLDDVMPAAPHATDAIELEFITPTSIKVDGKWTGKLTFERLIRNLLRRIRFLSYFHCGEDLDVDAHGLIAASAAVHHDSCLKWLRKDRYSYRAEKSVPMGGFIGKIRFSGELEPFLPFIYLGEYLHIGASHSVWVWAVPHLWIGRQPTTDKLSRNVYPVTVLRRFSNQSRMSSCVITPRPIRITAIIATQIKRRTAPLTIAIRRSTASIAAIIKNIGELMNSGISHPVSS